MVPQRRNQARRRERTQSAQLKGTEGVAAMDTLRRVGADRGAPYPARADRDIVLFAPHVAITYVFITPAAAFPPCAREARSPFDKNRDQAVTARHGTELALPAVNKHDSPFIASMDANHVKSRHRHFRPGPDRGGHRSGAAAAKCRQVTLPWTP